MAREDITGFSELYARCPYVDGATGKFVVAFNSDIIYWSKLGHSDLAVKCKFAKVSKRKEVPSVEGSVAGEDQTEDSGEQDTLPTESPEVLEDKAEKLQARISCLEKELYETNERYDTTLEWSWQMNTFRRTLASSRDAIRSGPRGSHRENRACNSGNSARGASRCALLACPPCHRVPAIPRLLRAERGLAGDARW